MSDSARELAREMFLTAAGAVLVQDMVRILEPLGIPLMPLKGVLLQRWIYGETVFRPMVDVDVLVPERHFSGAVAALKAAGYSTARWAVGRWQVTLRKQEGPPLGVDLHRRLSRTTRSLLTAEGLFARGSVNTALFGVTIVLPAPEDLFAHLVLHTALHWVRRGELHHPSDFVATAQALSLDLRRCAEHLRTSALVPHALLVLPLILQRTGAPFIAELIGRLNPGPRAVAAAGLAREVCSRLAVGHPARRIGGLALAPSLPGALTSALRDRLASAMSRHQGEV